MWGLWDTCGTLSGSYSGSLHHELATTQATFHLINAHCCTCRSSMRYRYVFIYFITCDKHVSWQPDYAES